MCKFANRDQMLKVGLLHICIPIDIGTNFHIKKK